MDPQASDDGQVAAQPQQQPLEWRFAQVFGERAAGEDVQEVDIISAIEFDRSGDHLATGDKGGRVVLFERTDARDNANRRELERQDVPASRHPEFRYKTEFQSHEPEACTELELLMILFIRFLVSYGCEVGLRIRAQFDYLKSLEIEEKINKIKWCETANNALSLLSTNDKTIKYWKVQEKKVKRVSVMNLDTSQSVGSSTSANASTSSSKAPLPSGGCSEKLTCLSSNFSFPPGGYPSLRLPVVIILDRCLYNVQSILMISLAFCCLLICSDGETFISADDLRINLWNLEINSQSFNIVDVKPSNMEDLTGPVSTFQVHEHLRPKSVNTLFCWCFDCSNIFRVFGCTPGSTEATTLEASRNPMR
ncbi:hypothetical protein PR202_gb27715 [Eleusine coracana subsp. coracana]|uniref:Serine/threonine-protein phosphatase 2A 55 kDa regulatory subunit B n=1 Tax=Eleusine coracana subsp. coracana TaxID=191504 RepID=A0AAV5FVH9_ELECO|nr:hypothetical protein PR202_gb27715 [Eleusine coracana subsp. coracana]